MNQNMNNNQGVNPYNQQPYPVNQQYPGYPVNQPMYNYPNPYNQKKSSKVWLWVLLGVIGFFAVIFVIAFIVGTKLIETGELLDGKWICDNDIVEFNTDEKRFVMYNSSQTIVINGTYKINGYHTSVTNGDAEYKYDTNFSIEDKKVDGKSYGGGEKNAYEITIYGDDQESMTLHDVEDNESFACHKED